MLIVSKCLPTIHRERSKKKNAELPLQNAFVLCTVLTLSRRKKPSYSKHVFARFALNVFLLQVIGVSLTALNERTVQVNARCLYVPRGGRELNKVKFPLVEFLKAMVDERPRGTQPVAHVSTMNNLQLDISIGFVSTHRIPH